MSIGLWTAFLLLGFQVGKSQPTPWLTDEQARDVAGAAIHSVYPEPCYSTYRNENLEDSVLSIRKNPIVGNHINNSVYFYRVASDFCRYLVEKDGKYSLTFQVSLDCCEYGIVAIDRATAKSYWFAGEEKATEVFKTFVQDEQLQPDSSRPTLFTGLYLDLVWGESNNNEITSLGQLRDLVQKNFKSAYSAYERDEIWQSRFGDWWRKFQSRMPKLKLETTYEAASGGILVRGYAFKGFELTIPQSDPPPRGSPKLYRWALLVTADGRIEERASKVIYASR